MSKELHIHMSKIRGVSFVPHARFPDPWASARPALQRARPGGRRTRRQRRRRHSGHILLYALFRAIFDYLAFIIFVMEHIPNGDLPNGGPYPPAPLDGPIPKALDGLSLEELERELPTVNDGMIPLGELVSRMAQAIYAELIELADT